MKSVGQLYTLGGIVSRTCTVKLHDADSLENGLVAKNVIVVLPNSSSASKSLAAQDGSDLTSSYL